MAVLRWAGGSTARSQVDSLTPGGSTIEVGDIFNVTLTDESGSTQTEAVVSTGTTVATVCDDVVLQCSASTQSLFRRLTFTDATTSVTVTAKTPGVPFYLTATTTESGGGASDSQTFVRASVTTNKGPNDFNDVDNWVESDGTAPSTVPEDGDEVIFSEGSHDLLFGLRQQVDLEQLRVTGGFTGSIGQPNHALDIDVSNESSSTLPILALGGRGRRYNLQGAYDEVIITRNSGQIDIKGTGMGSFTIVGPHAKGIITIKNGSTFTTGNQSIRQLLVDGVSTYIESGVTGIKPVRVDGGYMETRSGFGNANADAFDLIRGTVCFKGSADVKTVNVNGGLMKWESDQNIGSSANTPLTIYGGEVDVKRNTKVGTLTVNKPTVFNGVLDISAESSNVALSSPDSQQATVYYGMVKYPTVAGQTSGTVKNNNRNII